MVSSSLRRVFLFGSLVAVLFSLSMNVGVLVSGLLAASSALREFHESTSNRPNWLSHSFQFVSVLAMLAGAWNLDALGFYMVCAAVLWLHIVCWLFALSNIGLVATGDSQRSRRKMAPHKRADGSVQRVALPSDNVFQSLLGFSAQQLAETSSALKHASDMSEFAEDRLHATIHLGSGRLHIGHFSALLLELFGLLYAAGSLLHGVLLFTSQRSVFPVLYVMFVTAAARIGEVLGNHLSAKLAISAENDAIDNCEIGGHFVARDFCSKTIEGVIASLIISPLAALFGHCLLDVFVFDWCLQTANGAFVDDCRTEFVSMAGSQHLATGFVIGAAAVGGDLFATLRRRCFQQETSGPLNVLSLDSFVATLPTAFYCVAAFGFVNKASVWVSF